MGPSANLETSDRGRASYEALAWRHHRFGWWSLFVFATLGLVLESLAGLRVGWYVDAGNETRHTMMRLAHAHGSLLAIINVVFSSSVRAMGPAMRRCSLASTCLVAATVSIPFGFLLGGLWFYEADPGLGILLVPLGALALLIAVAHVAAGTSSRPT